MAIFKKYFVSRIGKGVLGTFLWLSLVTDAQALTPQAIPTSLTPGGGLNIQWPSNTINLSQIETIFSQFPAIGNFNIQFPNKTNWAITPAYMQNLASTYIREAQSLGVGDKLPDLGFSSLSEVALSGAGVKSGLAQLAIGSIQGNGDIKGQMDNVLQQLQSGNSPLLNMLPDWLKRTLLAVYNAVYQALDFMGAQLAALFHKQ